MMIRLVLLIRSVSMASMWRQQVSCLLTMGSGWRTFEDSWRRLRSAATYDPYSPRSQRRLWICCQRVVMSKSVGVVVEQIILSMELLKTLPRPTLNRQPQLRGGQWDIAFPNISIRSICNHYSTLRMRRSLTVQWCNGAMMPWCLAFPLMLCHIGSSGGNNPKYERWHSFLSDLISTIEGLEIAMARLTYQAPY